MCVCVCVCVCVWLGRNLLFKHIWLNNKDTFYLYDFIKILSSFLIIVLISGWNWLGNLPIDPQRYRYSLVKRQINYNKEKMNTFNTVGKFIHLFQPETKTIIRKLESILIKSYRQNVSLLSNQTCLYIYIYIYIYIYRERERERERERGFSIKNCKCWYVIKANNQIPTKSTMNAIA